MPRRNYACTQQLFANVPFVFLALSLENNNSLLFHNWGTSLLLALIRTSYENIIRYITPFMKVTRFCRQWIRGTWLRFAVQSKQTRLCRMKRHWGCCCDCPCQPRWIQYLTNKTPLLRLSCIGQPAALQSAIVLRSKKQLINGRDWGRPAGMEHVKGLTTNKQRAAQCGIQIEEPHDVGWQA